MGVISYEMGIFGMPNPDYEERRRIEEKEKLSSKINLLERLVPQSTIPHINSNPLGYVAEKIISTYWDLTRGSVSPFTEHQLTEAINELNGFDDKKIEKLMPSLIENYLRREGESNNSIQIFQHYNFNPKTLRYNHHNAQADLIEDVTKTIKKGILEVKTELSDVIDSIINIEMPRLRR